MTTVADVDLSTWNRYLSSPRLRGSDPFGSNLISVGQAVESDLAQSIATGGLNTPFAITREASRTSGTAPLSVFFTAGFSESDGTNRDFHDLHYLWDFDDAGAGTWATSGKSKETDIGAVASHVFESAETRTHTVTLTVIDPSTGSTLDTDTFSIVVTAADTTFAGTLTTVINKVGDTDFTGKPTGATEVNTDNLADLTTYLGSGKRVLLKRGSTWAHSGAVTMPTITSACHLGAYGTGTSPDSRGIYTNAPIITCTGSSALFTLNDIYDFRFTDVTLTGTTTNAVLSGGTDTRQFLMLRLKTTGFLTSLGWGHWRLSDADIITENSIVSCDVGNFDTQGIFGGSEKLTLMGNAVYNSDTTHVIRVWWTYLGVISHNTISGASIGNTNARHGLKLHGPKEITELGTFAETSNGGIPDPTKYVLVANNVVGSSGYVPVSIGPQDSGSNENLSDIIVEKNRVIAAYGDTSTTHPSAGIIVEGRYQTLRNNIVDGTLSTNNYVGIIVERRGAEDTPIGTHVYNNVVYNNYNVLNGPTGIEVHSTAINTIIKNNYISFPASGSKTAINDASGVSTVSNNQMVDIHGFVDVNNVTPLSRDYSLATGSAGIDAGTDVLVYDDFNDAIRTGTFEQGAFIYVP